MQKDHTDKIKRLEAQSEIVHSEFEKTMQNAIELLKQKGITIAPKSSPRTVEESGEIAVDEFEKTRKHVNKISGKRTAVNVCCKDIAQILDNVGCEKYNVQSSKEALSVLSSLNGHHNIVMFINVILPDTATVDFVRETLGVKADRIIVLNGSTVTPEIMELLSESNIRPWFRPIKPSKVAALFDGFCEE